ncbi:hypothetical protein [Sphingomonas sp. ID0503]|uniref:hypothetical protein n=1 Tax=Sphingomonas sp. ID0503 TaxID=3399691 RepID=UPI003AFB6CC7
MTMRSPETHSSILPVALSLAALVAALISLAIFPTLLLDRSGGAQSGGAEGALIVGIVGALVSLLFFILSLRHRGGRGTKRVAVISSGIAAVLFIFLSAQALQDPEPTPVTNYQQ